jgi:large subunit ribosomal protein L10
MSKYVKNLIMRDVAEKFKGVEGLAVINPRGINATKNNQIRRKLRDKKLRMTVVKNSLARKALSTDESKLKGFDQLLDGPSALVYGEASIATIARLLLDEKKADDKIELRGVYFDGEIYPGQKGVEQVSKMPTREEAIRTVLAAILSPGKKLVGALVAPGRNLAGILKAIEEKAKTNEPAATAEAAPAAEAAPSA